MNSQTPDPQLNSAPSEQQTKRPTPSPSPKGRGEDSPLNGKTICPPPSQGGAGGESVFPRRIKGTLVVFNSDNDCEFHAQRSTGISSQEVIAKYGSSKLYKTTGRKPQMVAYLITPADTSDPISDLYDQLDRLTAKQKTKARPRLRGRILLDEACGNVIYSKKDNTIDMHLQIDLNAAPDYNNQLILIMQKISQCFLINQNSLVQLRS